MDNDEESRPMATRSRGNRPEETPALSTAGERDQVVLLGEISVVTSLILLFDDRIFEIFINITS